MRCVNVHDQGRWLKSLVIGVFNYFGVPENRKSLDGFRTAICKMRLKSLRRRSQRGSTLTWNRFNRLVRQYIPSVRLNHPYPNQRWCVWLKAGAVCVSSARTDLRRGPSEWSLIAS
jgi:hypothetical protein